jgi:hypothetical protein
MYSRDRDIAALRFETVDRVPLQPGGARRSTLEVWHRQGLPADSGDYNAFAYRLAGGALPWPESGPVFPVNERMIPQFEELVLEERPASRVVQDWKGNICEIGREFSPEYLRNAIDFVTRKWIKCPVEHRRDWADMQHRYDSNDPARLPPDPAALAARLKDRTWFVELHFSGPFWQLREWVGFETLCTLFYDDPALTAEMIRFWEEHVARLLERALAIFTPDSVHLSEDMAYKEHSMISPQMAREFLMPTWTRWGEIVRKAGVPLYGMDSDGHIGELIPLWIESGINFCDPIEVAAGNDIVAFRKRFGRNMAYRGGIDKRAMARGGLAIEREIDRIRPVIRDGGFIPGCDHGVPSDVAWPDYTHYVKRLAEATGWL